MGTAARPTTGRREAVAPTTMELEALQNLFTYHQTTQEQNDHMTDMRLSAFHLATKILTYCPPCADRTRAINELRTVVMVANASIALKGANLAPPGALLGGSTPS